MHGEGRKSRVTIGHSVRPVLACSKNAGAMLIASSLCRQGDRFTYSGLAMDVLHGAALSK
jgi:hypothetical protein